MKLIKKSKLLMMSLGAAISVTLVTQNIALAAEKEHGGMEITIPDTAEGILAEIDKHEAELNQVVTNKKLAEVHQHAFAIRDLAKALVEKAAADKKARVEGTVNNISKLAEALDKSGDSGDQATTEANLKKFDGMLKLLKGQFN